MNYIKFETVSEDGYMEFLDSVTSAGYTVLKVFETNKPVKNEMGRYSMLREYKVVYY